MPIPSKQRRKAVEKQPENLGTIGRLRDDVAQAVGARSWRLSGWVATFPRTALPAGMHRTRITAWALDTDTARAYRLPGASLVKQ